MINTSIIRQVAIASFVTVPIMSFLIWNLMDREAPYEFTRVAIEPYDVPKGGTIAITFWVDLIRAPCGPGLVYREFKEASGKLHVYDPVLRTDEPSVIDGKFTRIVVLPDNMTAGKTIYRGVACYTCNPIHHWLRWPVCVKTPDVEFNVIE